MNRKTIIMMICFLLITLYSPNFATDRLKIPFCCNDKYISISRVGLEKEIKKGSVHSLDDRVKFTYVKNGVYLKSVYPATLASSPSDFLNLLFSQSESGTPTPGEFLARISVSEIYKKNRLKIFRSMRKNKISYLDIKAVSGEIQIEAILLYQVIQKKLPKIPGLSMIDPAKPIQLLIRLVPETKDGIFRLKIHSAKLEQWELATVFDNLWGKKFGFKVSSLPFPGYHFSVRILPDEIELSTRPNP